MWLLKVLVSIGLKVFRLVIYFPKHMLLCWLQPMGFQDLVYFQSYLKKGQTNKKTPTHRFYKMISTPVFLQVVIAFFLTARLPDAFSRVPLILSFMLRITDEHKDALVLFWHSLFIEAPMYFKKIFVCR